MRTSPLVVLSVAAAALALIAALVVTFAVWLPSRQQPQLGVVVVEGGGTPGPAQPPTLAPARPAPAPQGRGLVGRWAGPVVGDKQAYDVEVVITGINPITGTVRYPQLDCSGTWLEHSRSSDGGYVVAERITQGAARCIAEADVGIVFLGEIDRIEMEIFTTRDGRTPTATLTRR